MQRTERSTPGSITHISVKLRDCFYYNAKKVNKMKTLNFEEFKEIQLKLNYEDRNLLCC